MDLRKREKDLARSYGLPGRRKTVLIESVSQNNKRKFNSAPLPTYRGSKSVRKGK